MIDRIVAFSIEQRVLIVALWLLVVAVGVHAATELPIDAVPDVTTNQVVINTRAPSFAPLEMEKYVTFPIEVAMSSLPRREEIRSISQFGLSQVTIVFDDSVDVYWARQVVLERLRDAERELPPGLSPELGPVSTGLGEILQFTLEKEKPGPSPEADLMELHTLLEWFVAPELRNVPGVVEVNNFGGYEKQYEVLADPRRLVAYGVTLTELREALERNNANAGGGYLVSRGEQLLVRGEGLIQSVRDIENIVVRAEEGRPVYVRDVATVGLGHPVRTGAATRDGQGETVLGIAILLKGENSRTVTQRVRARLEQLQGSLPPGVRIDTFYDRSDLVERTIGTASRNLVEGGLLVAAILFLFLLQIRAGLIVSSAIPLSMLVALIGMRYMGVSANLMSLGAIDFGLIVDAAVIIVENCVRRLAEARRALGRALSPAERRQAILDGTVEVRRASQFGELMILAAYLPILALTGMEGKMFRPMALTVILALSGALLLSLTLVPALCAFFLREERVEHHNPVLVWLEPRYAAFLRAVLRRPAPMLVGSLLLVAAALGVGSSLGAEFLPELDEGSLAINHVRLKSVPLTETVRQADLVEQTIRKFPEVQTVVSRIGRPAIATDPMGPEMVDTYVMLKPAHEWTPGRTRASLVEAMEEELARLPGMAFSFSQPIKFRMMELIEGIGIRADVGVKIYGDDLEVLQGLARQVAGAVRGVPGAADVKEPELSGLPVLEVRMDREALARHGLNVSDVQEVIETAIAGTQATEVLEGFTRLDLMVRLPEWARDDVQAIASLPLLTPDGRRIPLSQVARIVREQGPSEVSREGGRRRVAVEVNVRGRDIGSFVEEARERVRSEVKLPAGYVIDWGGMYEHLESGRNRLMIVVPLTFLLIFMLLFTTFGSAHEAGLVFTGIPFALSGGVLALAALGMHFSMSAGVGLVAVSGVAVLNGVVMLTFIKQLHEQGEPPAEAVVRGSLVRLRPVLMTALVAALGFVPMALSHGTGAEVQRPLAVVVIGGILTSTALTLFVLPALYHWLLLRREVPEAPEVPAEAAP